MKPLLKMLLVSIFYVYPALALFPQDSNWMVYTNGDRVNCQVIRGNYNWVGTDGGIVKINVSTGETEYMNTGNSGLQQNNVRCLEADKNGNIWVGNLGTTFCGGLASFNGNDWIYYDLPNYKKYNSITVGLLNSTVRTGPHSTVRIPGCRGLIPDILSLTITIQNGLPFPPFIREDWPCTMKTD